MLVLSLVEISGNSIAASSSSKSQRKVLCHELLQYSLPTRLVVGVISQLPIDEILMLEKEFPSLTTVFEEAWRRVCQKCAMNSFPFRCKLTRTMLTKKRAITFPLLYWSFANEFIFFGNSSWTYRDIFFSSYLSELLYSYTQDNFILARSYGSDSINANMKPAKIVKRDCQLILQSALGSCKHGILDKMMIKLILSHISTLTLNLRIAEPISTLLKDFEKLDNLKELVIHGCTGNQGSKIELIESILSKSPIQTVHLTVEQDSENFCMIKKMIGLFSATKNSTKLSSLWDEALTNCPQQPQDCSYNDEDSDIYEFCNTQPSPPHKNIYHITALYVSMGGSMRTYDKHDLFSDCFNYWYRLETLCLSLQYNNILTRNFYHAIRTLLSSNRSKLKNVKVVEGHFDVATFCSLGLCLNGTEVPKSVVFYNCHIMDFSNEDEGIHICPKHSDESYASINKVSLVEPFFRRWHSGKFYSVASVVSIILQCYNPSKMYIYHAGSKFIDDKKHNPTVELSANEIKLTKLIFDQPLYQSGYDDVLALLSDTARYNSKNIDVDIISSRFNACKYEGNFKNVTITHKADLKHDADHSMSDFVAQM